MIGHMIIDLAIFLILWGIILTLSTSASSLIFAETNPILADFFDNIVWHFEAALGNWD